MKQIIFFFFLFTILKTTTACTCIGDTNIQSEFDSIDVVFKGIILSVEPPLYVPNIREFIKDSFPNFNFDSTMTKTVVAAYNKFRLRWDTVSYRTVTIKVEKLYKSGRLLQLKSDSIITISTGKGYGDCGYQFDVGYDYIVWAYEDIYKRYKSPLLSGYTTNICTFTSAFSDMAYYPQIKRMFEFLEQLGQ